MQIYSIINIEHDVKMHILLLTISTGTLLLYAIIGIYYACILKEFVSSKVQDFIGVYPEQEWIHNLTGFSLLTLK